MWNKPKHIKSKYKHVRGLLNTNGKIYYTMQMKGVSEAGFDCERKCAIAVDKKLIEQGKEPVNILIRK